MSLCHHSFWDGIGPFVASEKRFSVFQRAEFFQFRPVRTSPRHISAPLESSGTPENNLDESTAISSEHLGSLITFSISCRYEQTLLNSNLRMSRISLCELCDCTMLCNVYKYWRYPQRQFSRIIVQWVRDSVTRSNLETAHCTVANKADIHRAHSSCISLFLPSFGVSRFSAVVRVCGSALAQNNKQQLFKF